MNQINIQRNEGFPVQRRTLDFLQDTFGSAIEHICRMHGDNLILHGVVVGGTTVSAGAVVINGELLPFEQSAVEAEQTPIIEIVENAEAVLYHSGEILDTYFTRVARISENGTIPLSSLHRMPKLPMPTDWVDCTPVAITVVEPVRCRVNEKGKVELRGKFRYNTDLLRRGVDFRLPAGCIPNNNIATFVTEYPFITNSPNVVPLQILSNGIVRTPSEVRPNPDDQVVYELNSEFDL